MLDYIISLKILLFAGATGGGLGYLLSYIIDKYFFDPQAQIDTPDQTTDNNYHRGLNAILWGIALVCIWSALFISAAAFDYLLSFAPMSHGMRFLENETIVSTFSGGFLVGMSSTFLKLGELAFAALKKE